MRRMVTLEDKGDFGDASLALIVSVIAYRDESAGSRILLQRRYVEREYWGDFELPQGHMRRGETMFDCARREFAEETGMRVVVASKEQGRRVGAICIESSDPMLVVKVTGSMNYLAVCYAGTVEGGSLGAYDPSASGHVWVSASELREILDGGSVFPLNRPMLERWIERGC